jgi:hypothetical protein
LGGRIAGFAGKGIVQRRGPRGTEMLSVMIIGLVRSWELKFAFVRALVLATVLVLFPINIGSFEENHV